MATNNKRGDRQQARTRLLKLIRVKNSEDKRLFGHVVDISIGGMKVNTNIDVKVGDHLNFLIELPLAISSTPLDVRVEATWIGTTDKHNGHDVGCRFIAIEKANRDVLLKLIEKYPMGTGEI